MFFMPIEPPNQAVPLVNTTPGRSPRYKDELDQVKDRRGPPRELHGGISVVHRLAYVIYHTLW